MKRSVGLVLVILFMIHCDSKTEVVKKFVQNGAEVILNRMEPYKIMGEPMGFTLEREFSIDFSRDEIGELGIANSVDFEVDSKGCVYFFYADKEGDLIFKFDEQGNYSESFGSKGQGPGEMQYIVWTGITSRDHLIVSDNGNRKILIFTKDGDLIRETRFPSGVGLLYPLDNGNYFGLWDKHPATAANSMYMWAFSLYGPDFEEIKLLDAQNVYDFNTQGFRGIHSRPFFKRKISDGFIYIASEERGYEIMKYDLEGRLVQIIRKEHEPVPVSQEIIVERKKQYESMGTEVWFPKHWLPLCDIFLDDEGRIYAKTFEDGPNPGEYLYDLFNSEGIFIGRTALNVLTLGDSEILAKVRGGRLYYFQEKPDGFRECIVSRMIWE